MKITEVISIHLQIEEYTLCVCTRVCVYNQYINQCCSFSNWHLYLFLKNTYGCFFLLCRSFDGFSSAQKNQEQLLTLASILREEGKVFDEKVYYTAGYNSPFKLLDRNNEVWLIQRHEASKESE